MPTLNEYTNDDGYFIRARPSDTGNITYQLEPRGEQIVEKVGYQGGDEIGWQVINALKVPNLIYTGDGGTTDDDISVDLDKEEIEALSEEDAKRLLDELLSVPRVGDSQTDEIEEILGLTVDSQLDNSRLAATIKSRIVTEVITDKYVYEVIGANSEFPNCIRVNVVDVYNNEEYNKSKLNYKILIGGVLGEQFRGEKFKTQIGVRENDGIVSAITKVDEGITTVLVAEYQKFMAEMLPIITSELESVGIEPGPPEALPGVKVTSMD